MQSSATHADQCHTHARRRLPLHTKSAHEKCTRTQLDHRSSRWCLCSSIDTLDHCGLVQWTFFLLCLFLLSILRKIFKLFLFSLLFKSNEFRNGMKPYEVIVCVDLTLLKSKQKWSKWSKWSMKKSEWSKWSLNEIRRTQAARSADKTSRSTNRSANRFTNRSANSYPTSVCSQWK